MKIVKGYVFLVKFSGEEREYLFGRKSDSEDSKLFERFESNGLDPYRLVRDARTGAQDYLSRSKTVNKLDLAQIRLKIAENEGDLPYFMSRSGLIAIMSAACAGSSNQIMYGDIVEGRPNSKPLPGAELCENGYTPFMGGGGQPFLEVDHLCNEIARQGMCRAQIAQFKLKRLESLVPLTL